MDNLVHNADHVLLVLKRIGSGTDICSTDDSLTNNGSSGSGSLGASSSLGNEITGRLGFYQEDPVSVDTTPKCGRCASTTDRAAGDFQASNSRVLDLESAREVVHDGRNKFILDVVSH